MTAALRGTPAGARRVDEDSLVAEVATSRVLDLEGTAHRMRDLWGSGPSVNVFIRQFGCLFCQQTVHDMLELVPEITLRGGQLVLVGCGTPEQAARFASSRDLPRDGVQLVCDPSRNVFDAASLERGWARVFLHPGSLRSYVEARQRGFVIKGVFGDVPQLGGVMVVAPPARLRFMHRALFAGDEPAQRDVVAALG